MALNRRSRLVLAVIVESYIDDAAPISSQTVAKRLAQVTLQAPLGLCPASLRAVMAELEARELLTRPHKSAGCRPTERGLRVYLDQLMAPRLHPWDRTHLEAEQGTEQATSFPTRLGRRLAHLSGQVALVALPTFAGSSVREIGLVHLGANRILALAVSPHGAVHKKVVALAEDIAVDQLQAMQNFLNARLAGAPLAEVHQRLADELDEALSERDLLRLRAAELGSQLMPQPAWEVLVAGVTQLLHHPEFADLGHLRAVLVAIEEKELMLKLLDGLVGHKGVCVRLGSEHAAPLLANMASVGCGVLSAGGCGSAVTLLGPMRMDFGRLMPLVSHASTLLDQYVERL